jgi:hypothetical protein
MRIVALGILTPFLTHREIDAALSLFGADPEVTWKQTNCTRSGVRATPAHAPAKSSSRRVM